MRTKAAAVSWAHKMHSSRWIEGFRWKGRMVELPVAVEEGLCRQVDDADEGQVPGESGGSEKKKNKKNETQLRKKCRKANNFG